MLATKHNFDSKFQDAIIVSQSLIYNVLYILHDVLHSVYYTIIQYYTLNENLLKWSGIYTNQWLVTIYKIYMKYVFFQEDLYV